MTLAPSLALALLVGCTEPQLGPPPPPSGAISSAQAPELAILPHTDQLPANALTFELHWSKSMRLGPQATHVRNAADQEVEGALTKLTFDAPVRVATVQLTPLPPGAYTLRVDGFVASDGGLGKRTDHPFTVLPADTEPPDGAAIKVRGKPMPHTSEVVTVHFPEPMHHGVVNSLTALGGPSPWEGEWTLSADQATLTYTPAIPWPDAPVTVSIGAGASDLAGNGVVNLPPGMLTPMIEIAPPEPAPEEATNTAP